MRILTCPSRKMKAPKVNPSPSHVLNTLFRDLPSDDIPQPRLGEEQTDAWRDGVTW